MTKDKEKDYERGFRSACNLMVSHILGYMGYEDIENLYWVIERESIIVALRALCDDFGDNDWDEHLNLSDVIEKHLGRYLYNKAVRTDKWTDEELKIAESEAIKLRDIFNQEE